MSTVEIEKKYYCPNCSIELASKDAPQCPNCSRAFFTGFRDSVLPTEHPIGRFDPNNPRALIKQENPTNQAWSFLIRFFVSIVIWVSVGFFAVASALPYGGGNMPLIVMWLTILPLGLLVWCFSVFRSRK
jgi:DNA-directed RNA polymerase subunit RPC12/RpoP